MSGAQPAPAGGHDERNQPAQSSAQGSAEAAVLSHYRLDKTLGIGSFGKVSAATGPRLRQDGGLAQSPPAPGLDALLPRPPGPRIAPPVSHARAPALGVNIASYPGAQAPTCLPVERAASLYVPAYPRGAAWRVRSRARRTKDADRSQVKLAEHILTGQKVAIKILNRKKIKAMDMEEKVRREIKILRCVCTLLFRKRGDPAHTRARRGIARPAVIGL